MAHCTPFTHFGACDTCPTSLSHHLSFPYSCSDFFFYCLLHGGTSGLTTSVTKPGARDAHMAFTTSQSLFQSVQTDGAGSYKGLTTSKSKHPVWLYEHFRLSTHFLLPSRWYKGLNYMQDQRSCLSGTLYYCCLKHDAAKPQVIENKICEGTDCLKAALSSGVTNLQVMVACKKCGLGEQWSSDIVVSRSLTKHPDIQSENYSKHYDSHHWPDSPLTKQITHCFFYCVSGLWPFCEAVLFLTNVFVTKVWNCHELDPWNIIHIPGFITPNFLPVSWLWQF
jgi:hypothetical protein